MSICTKLSWIIKVSKNWSSCCMLHLILVLTITYFCCRSRLWARLWRCSECFRTFPGFRSGLFARLSSWSECFRTFTGCSSRLLARLFSWSKCFRTFAGCRSGLLASLWSWSECFRTFWKCLGTWRITIKRPLYSPSWCLRDVGRLRRD